MCPPGTPLPRRTKGVNPTVRLTGQARPLAAAGRPTRAVVSPMGRGHGGCADARAGAPIRGSCARASSTLTRRATLGHFSWHDRGLVPAYDAGSRLVLDEIITRSGRQRHSRIRPSRVQVARRSVGAGAGPKRVGITAKSPLSWPFSPTELRENTRLAFRRGRLFSVRAGR